MQNVPSSSSLEEQAQVVVEVIPVEEEEDDVDALAVAGQITTDVKQEAISLEGFDVKALPGEEHERGVDVILLLTLMSTGIVASKDLLTSIFDLLTSVIELLIKRDHVQEIEVIIGGKTFIFRDLTKKTAKELVDDLATRHSEATQTLITEAKIQTKAKVSKRRRTKN